MQRATLVPFKDDAAPLKKKVPYDQLRPYKTSELHDMQKTEQNTDFSSPSDEFSSSSDDIQSLFEGTSPPCSNTTSPCNDDSLILIHDSPPLTNDNKTDHKKTNDNKADHNKWKCTANGNPEELLLTIIEDHWLTDEHIDHAQWLLSKQFPDSKEIHLVLAFEIKPPKVQKGDKDFVQILHVGGNHWVTVTNIGCQENRIKVFDSLRQKLSKKEKQKLCSSLAVLLNTSSSNLVIEWPSMQRQRGESDCGLFAVAVATSLLNGEDPGSKSYDQSVMRGHLAVCFHCEEYAVFPVSSSKCAINDKKEETIEVFCHCRMPFKDGVFMIECSVCLEWFHRSCHKVPRTVTDKTLFHCMSCK